MSAPIKEGFMEKRYHKGRMGKQWTKRWVLLYDISDSGIPRLETFDSDEQSKKDVSRGMIIPLNADVHKIVASSHAPKKDFTIDIVMGHDKMHTFAVDTKAEQEHWLQLMQRVANLGKRSSLTPPSHKKNRYDTHQPQKTLDSQVSRECSSSIDSFHAEENTLYDSFDVKQYTVRIQDNDFTRSTLKLHGTYILCLDSLKLTLVHPEQGNMLYAWPYKYLRRYGRDKTSFSMEAGRKCQSGPGLIVFETTEGNNIFHEIQNFVNSISTSQPLNAAQQVKRDHHKNSGSHEDLSSKVKQMSLPRDDQSQKPRTHSMSGVESVTQSDEFKKRIAARRQETYAQQAITGKASPNPKLAADMGGPLDADQIYSEVSEQEAMADQPRMPIQEPYDGDYDLAGDMGMTGPPPPDSDEYDELSNLYTNPQNRVNGDAWKKFALPKDNIHTETYITGEALRTSEGARMPPPVKRRTSNSPKVKPKHEQKKTSGPEESLYSIATGPSPPTPAAPPPHHTDNEVYDHLDRHQKPSKPTPVPRRSGPPLVTTRKPPPSKPVPKSPVQQEEAPIYDHLDRQNKGKPTTAPKPKPSIKPAPKVDPNATYGTLFQEQNQGQAEESAYGHLGNTFGDPVDVVQDQAGYLTRAEAFPHKEYPNEQEYDDPIGAYDTQRQVEDPDEGLYDLPGNP